MESLWRKQIENLSSDLKTEHVMLTYEDTCYDVVVIGAGMAGLLTAYFLKEQGKRVIILEADKVASGQTEKTTAKITSQQGLKYSSLITEIGKEKAGLYAKANEEAIGEYEKLIKEKGIDCGFERVPAFLYSRKEDDALKKEAEAAALLGINSFFTLETQLPFPVAGALCFINQAQFSPLEFAKHIASELKILENTKVIKVKSNRVITEDKTFLAKKVVVATHYPIFNVPGFYFLRQHQERSYVLALSGCKKIDGMYYGIDKDGLSLRQAGEYLLLGGGNHRTGENTCGGKYKMLSEAAKQLFPDGKEEMHWSAQDCMTHDGLAFIGKYSVFTPNLFVATGFQKWGMTSSMIAAMILRDEICGKKNHYAKLFSPQRINVRAGAFSLFHDMVISVKGLTKGWIGRRRKGEESFRCPHMGCALTWNPDEESWDCPCHGSRFDKNGKLIDNPAKTSKV